MANKGLWSEDERIALQRNYPRYGSDTSKWDMPISRERKAIAAKASKMGIAFKSGCRSILGKEQKRRLEYVTSELCDRLGLSMRQLAHEVAILANEAGQ